MSTIEQLGNQGIAHEAMGRHIVKTCHSFISDKIRKSCGVTAELLHDAENIIDQIICYYGTLSAASAVLREYCEEDEKLPDDVLETLMFGIARERPALDATLEQIEALFTGHEMTAYEYGATQCFFEGIHKKIPGRAMLWDERGVMRHNPLKFNFMHHQAIDDQVAELFRRGAAGVEKILSYYPEMDDHSQALMSAKLARFVYCSKIPDDDPIRWILRDVVDPLVDAKTRIRQALNAWYGLQSSASLDAALLRVASLIETLEPSKVTEAFVEIEQTIDQAFDVESETVNNRRNPYFLSKLLHEAGKYGFDALEAMMSASEHRDSERLFLMSIIDREGVHPDFGYPTEACMWGDALLMNMNEDKLLSLGLKEKQLAWLVKLTGSQRYRQELQKSDAGRDVVFAQDLGL